MPRSLSKKLTQHCDEVYTLKPIRLATLQSCLVVRDGFAVLIVSATGRNRAAIGHRKRRRTTLRSRRMILCRGWAVGLSCGRCCCCCCWSDGSLPAAPDDAAAAAGSATTASPCLEPKPSVPADPTRGGGLELLPARSENDVPSLLSCTAIASPLMPIGDCGPCVHRHRSPDVHITCLDLEHHLPHE